MKKNVILFILAAVSLGIGILCLVSSKGSYSILAFTASLLFAVFGVRSYLCNRNPREVYDNKVKDILNTYDSILLKCSSVPEFDNRNIIRVESIDDLVDAQLEIRKPICYLKQSENCSFMLLDEKEVYVYVEKLEKDALSPVEIEINNMKFRKRENSDMDSEMLQDIDKTTIIKLSNKKSYKVSPIRKKKDGKKSVLKKADFEAEYLFDIDELKDVKAKGDDVEILDI